MGKIKKLERERDMLIESKPHLKEYQKKLDRLFAEAKGNTTKPSKFADYYKWMAQIGR